MGSEVLGFCLFVVVGFFLFLLKFLVHSSSFFFNFTSHAVLSTRILWKKIKI